jgi:hypothetical protein
VPRANIPESRGSGDRGIATSTARAYVSLMPSQATPSTRLTDAEIAAKLAELVEAHREVMAGKARASDRARAVLLRVMGCGTAPDPATLDEPSNKSQSPSGP